MEIKSIKYISLQRNYTKRFLLRLLLRNEPYPNEFVSGVTYDDHNLTQKKYLSNPVGDYLNEIEVFRKHAIIGCWIAHSHALENVIDKDGLTVVLEDDFICKPSFFGRALDMIKNFDRDFDVIIFDPRGTGPCAHHCIGVDKYATQGSTYPEYAGSQCLFVNNRSITKILDIKLSSRIEDIDGFLMSHRQINTFIFYTGLSKALWLGSDRMRINSIFIRATGAVEWLKYRFGRV